MDTMFLESVKQNINYQVLVSTYLVKLMHQPLLFYQLIGPFYLYSIINTHEVETSIRFLAFTVAR
jgi:hypothetical protein